MAQHPVLASVRKKLKDPTKPFVIIAELKARRGCGDRLAKAISKSYGIYCTRREPGCDGYEVCRDNHSKDLFIICEFWRNLEALKAHIASPQFVAIDRAVKRLLARKPVVRVMTSVPDQPPVKMTRSKRRKKEPEPSPLPETEPVEAVSWLQYERVRYPLVTGVAYFSGKALSVVVMDEDEQYGITVHREPIYGKVGRTALSPDCLEDYVQLKDAKVFIAGKEWNVNFSEIALRSDDEGLEMGGRLGLWGQDDPPSTDHLSEEEADKFLCDYFATAEFHQGTVWFQIKARWATKGEVEGTDDE